MRKTLTVIFICLDVFYYTTTAKTMDDSKGALYPFESVYFTTESDTTGYGKQNEEPGYHTKHDC